jgi:TM2 domain-containing membrane protein YozV
MIETLIVVLLVLWLLGVFGRRRMPRLRAGGNLIHILLVIILVLIVVRLMP